MEIMYRNQKSLPLLWNKTNFLVLVFAIFSLKEINAQCLSSVNPVGGTENLLVLEKNTLRLISFYKYAQGTQYFEKDKHSDFDLIEKGYINYLSTNVGYGLNNKITLDLDINYFINKTQVYNIDNDNILKGRGFSNFTSSLQYGLYTNFDKQMYYSLAAGMKIPSRTKPLYVNNVELPVELQPSLRAFGFVFESFFVKEVSAHGIRYFLTNRIEVNLENEDGYKLGNSIFNSLYFSKHLMHYKIKGDWTVIFQLRNEIRLPDEIDNSIKESSGGVLFFVVPQINYVLKEKWFLSSMIDVPIYQYFNGTQLGSGFGITFSFSRSFHLKSE